MELNIETFYNAEGIIDNEEDAIGKVNISFINKNESYKNGVLCGLMGLCVGCYDNGLPEEIQEVAEDPLVWYFDAPLKEILDEPNHKRYIISFDHLEEYGVYVATDNIIEFISGVASCPRAFRNSSNQDWKTLKYLDTTLISEVIILANNGLFSNKLALDLEGLLIINMINMNVYSL
jgi:hypothetical protein